MDFLLVTILEQVCDKRATGESVRGDGKHITEHTHITNIQNKWGSQKRRLRGDGLTYGQQTTALGGAECVCSG